MAISCQNAQNFFVKKRAESRVFPGKIPLFRPIILTTVPRHQRLSSDIVSSVDVLIQIYDFQFFIRIKTHLAKLLFLLFRTVL